MMYGSAGSIWNKCCQVFLIFIISFISSCHSQKVLFGTPTVTGVLNRSVVLEFKVNYTKLNATNPSTSFFFIDKIVPKIQLAGGLEAAFNVLTSTTNHEFVNRLEAAYDSSENSYKLIIKNLKYTDEQTFEGVLTYTPDNTNQNSKVAVSETELKIKGGPTACDPSLRPVYNATSGDNVTIPLTLCGNQRPFVEMSFDGGPRTIVTNITSLGQHKYIYHMELFNLVPSHCGKKLTYYASGYESDLVGETTIDVYFTPEINTLQADREKLCIESRWKNTDNGNCESIYYDVFFHYNNTSLVNTTSGKNLTGVDRHKYCLTDLGEAENITGVSLRYRYKDQTDTTSIVTVSIRTTTTSTTTSTTTTPTTISTTPAKPTAAPSSSDDNTALIAGVAGGIGGLVLIIIIVAVVCVCCRGKGKMKNQLQMTSIHEYDDQSKAENLTNGKAHKEDIENANAVPPTVDKDATEVVSSATLKFYDPNEFDIKPSNGYSMMTADQNSPPATPADPPPVGDLPPPPSSILSPDKVNKSYTKDEFDSDDDVAYENYDPKNGVDPKSNK